jgi:methylated-DNA-[protein]-cysteine S-methyltransferase
MTRVHTIIDSPIDPITLVAEDGKLRGLYMDVHRHRPDDNTFGPRDDTKFDQIVEELDQYFTGVRTSFDVSLAPVGHSFQHLVWNELRRIPYGCTISYGELADRIGKPGAARAVGSVNGQNPISIIVPCHRVIGANGHLVGYGGGLDRKQFLLDLEAARTEPTLFG